MAMARRLSVMFVAAVLVASLGFAAVAEGSVLGHTLRPTKLQVRPGAGQAVITKLEEGSFLTVQCRVEGSPVVGDIWWLKGFTVAGGQEGYVADFDMMCDGDTAAGHCDTVRHCVG